MPKEENELKAMRLLIRMQPELRESYEILTKIMDKGKFPINSFQDFSELMGGDDATMSFAGKVMKLRDVEGMVPSYYFPISNEHDLSAKVRDLTSRKPTVPSQETPSGVVLMPAKAEKPGDAGEPPRHLEQMHTVLKTPGLAGHHK